MNGSFKLIVDVHTFGYDSDVLVFAMHDRRIPNCSQRLESSEDTDTITEHKYKLLTIKKKNG